MSEIVSSPLIFSQQEVQDRFRLHQFIHKLFEPCRSNKGDLLGLTAEELFHIYKIQYPMNVLTTAIVSNMLLTGGFIEEENPEMSVLYAKIKEPYFMGLKKEAQMCLLPFIKDPLAIRYRQILIGIKVVNSDDGTLGATMEFGVHSFIEMFTLNYKNASNYMSAFATERRSSTMDVFNYYRLLCCIYKWPMADKILFSDVLSRMGIESTKGRVYGKAGMRYYPGLYIPQTIDDRVLSVELNMCCIFNGNTHWTREGILENMIEAQRAELCLKNLERMGFDEQERTSFEKEKTEINIRRTFETGEVPLGSTKKANETQNYLGHNGRLESKPQTIEVEALQTQPEDDISRTSGFKESKNIDAANNTPDRAPVDFTEPLDIGESYRDRYSQLCADVGSECNTDVGSGANNEELGGNTVESDGPSIEEIASALTVPYAMSVATGFTKEVMLSWLQKMNIANPDKVLEHYDDIMEILTH